MKNQPDRTKPERYPLASVEAKKIVSAKVPATADKSSGAQEREQPKTTFNRRRFDRTEHDGSDYLL
ncbi:MAG TPA: hypothetical protein VMR70_16455 [Flavisolibacter sp.]|nr:hypothetical protein [Flavisolibacter sp.]